MSAPDIKVLLGAEGVEQVLAAFRKVQKEVRETEKAAKSSTGGWGSLKQIAGEFSSGILPQLGAAAAGAALVGLGKQALDTADSMGKLAQKTGLTTETISVFGFAARTADVEAETLNKSLFKFTRTMEGVDSGSKDATQAVTELFGSAKALDGLTMDERLKKVTDALGSMEAGPKKAALAVRFFGKAGADMIPLLDDMAGNFDEVKGRAEAFGLVVSSDLAAAAQDANDRMTDLSSAAQGAAVQFMTGLAPAIADVATGLLQSNDQTNGFGEGLQWVGKIIGWLVKIVASTFSIVGNYIGTSIRLVWDFYAAIWEVGKALVNLQNPWSAFKDGMKVAFENAKENVKASVEQLKGIWQGAPDAAAPEKKKRGPDGDAGGGGDGGGKGKTPKAEKTPRQFDLSEFDKQELERAAALDREILAQQQAILSDAYKNGKVSLEDYYDTKIQLARQAAQIDEGLAIAEIERLQTKQAASTDEYEQAQLQLQINDLLYQQELNRLQLSGEIAPTQSQSGAIPNSKRQ